MKKRATLTAALNSVTEARQPASQERPPSREGKKAVTGFFSPEVSRALKQLALDNETSLQSLLAEAINDLFRKYGRPTIA